MSIAAKLRPLLKNAGICLEGASHHWPFTPKGRLLHWMQTEFRVGVLKIAGEVCRLGCRYRNCRSWTKGFVKMDRKDLMWVGVLFILLVVNPTIGRSDFGCCVCDEGLGCDVCTLSGSSRSAWGVSGDALFLTREDSASRVLAFNTSDPTQALDADDFRFGTQTGFDLSMRRSVGCRNAMELRFFSVDGWDAATTTATTANDLLQFNTAIPVFAFAGDAIAAQSSSKLNNGEINLLSRRNEWVEWLFGFRYLELDEQVRTSLLNAGVPVEYRNAARNRLYGGQAGANLTMLNIDRLSIDAIGKAGIFGNVVGHDASIDTGFGALTAGGNENRTSFVGELGFTGTYCFAKRVSLRSGYRLLWVDGVATASDQLAATDFFNGTGINSSGDVFYHGAFAGLAVKF